MKIAVLSDIHGNHVALEAVLKEVRRVGADRLFILGDSVGYYYRPDRVIELLSEWNVEWIKGNHEDMLKDAVSDSAKAEIIRTKYGSGIQKASELLDDSKIKMLTELPAKKMISLDGITFELCHGSPWDGNQYVYPDSSIEILAKCAASKADFVLMGHTHHSFIVTHEKTTLVNVGSVGQARDHGGLASWVLIETNNRSLIFKHTPYDVTTLIDEAKKNDPNLPYLQNILVRNNV